MKKLLPYVLVTLLGVSTSATMVGAFYAGERSASAQPAPSGSATAATPDLGSAAAGSDAASKLHDPVTDTKATISDLKAAEREGWGIFAFALLVILCKLAGRAPTLPIVGSKLAFLGKGTAALVVGAAGAFAVAAYNALTSGGSWMAVAFVGVIALAHYLPGPKPATT